MLKQELRKLREKDIMTIQERNKRLDMIKKTKILEKQSQTKNLINNAKQELEQTKKKNMEEDIKDQMNSIHLKSTFLNVTKSNLDPNKRNKILANSNVNIAISERLIRQNVHDEDQEV